MLRSEGSEVDPKRVYRLEGSRSRRTGGSGLGLAISRQLCTMHGWDIRLLSRAGGGTKASLRIPMQASVA